MIEIKQKMLQSLYIYWEIALFFPLNFIIYFTFHWWRYNDVIILTPHHLFYFILFYFIYLKLCINYNFAIFLNEYFVLMFLILLYFFYNWLRFKI